jgi:hypothetical protein
MTHKLVVTRFRKGVQVSCSLPGKFFLDKISKGAKVKIYPPSRFKRKPQRGDQRIFFGLNSEMFLKNVSFGPP